MKLNKGLPGRVSAYKVALIVLLLIAIRLELHRSHGLGSVATGQFQPNEVEIQLIRGESCVLAAYEPTVLLYQGISTASIVLRSTYETASNTISYEIGKDYEVDAARGLLWRVPGSRIPDFSTHPWYGKHRFNHVENPQASNKPYIVWVDYETTCGVSLATATDQHDRLTKLMAKLNQGGTVRIMAYGDSISAGGEASRPELAFFDRWIETLRSRFPKAEFQTSNKSRGGATSADGVASLSEVVLPWRPDLVLIGFGMNDFELSEEAFRQNLTTMVETVKRACGADVLLLSSFPAHPDWKYEDASRKTPIMAKITREVADSTQSAYADVFGVWQQVLRRKDHSSLLANNINHPNDFGHWLYLQALEAVKF